MKTLCKLIPRLLFGPSLEYYEARQKAENEKAVKAILANADTIERQGWDNLHKQAQYFRRRIEAYSMPPYRQEVLQNIRIKA